MGQAKNASPRSAGRSRVRWGLGLAVSVLIANALCLQFTNSTEVFVWDDDLAYSIRRAGQVHRQRTEGWADTEIGRYAVNGIPDITLLDGPKVILWGDSHVEGFPLADRDKLAQQFNRLARGKSVPTAFAVGLSGTTIGTAAYLLPRYEALAAPVTQHVFVITRLGYVMPEDGPSSEPYSLRSHPRPHFATTPPRRPGPRRQALLDLSRRGHLPLPYQLLRRVSRLDLRFRLGSFSDGADHERPERHPQAPDRLSELEETWAFLVESLASQAEAPIAFAYCPAVPSLDRGRLAFEDPDRENAERFSRACRRHEIPFLDLGADFASLYRTNGTFPRGFPNNSPHRGHLNVAGTRLLASRLVSFLAK